LGKNASALVHLAKCGERYFEDCVKLMTENNLYETAIQVYSESGQKDHLVRVTGLYGDFLLNRGSFEEAAFSEFSLLFFSFIFFFSSLLILFVSK
jgi:hypothetical protein